MNNRIFKYPLEVEQRQIVQMPAGARSLSVGVQYGEMPVLWALVDPDAPVAPVIVRGVTTGEVFNADGCEFVGTVQLKGWFVFHVFIQRQGVSDLREPRFQDDYAEARLSA